MRALHSTFLFFFCFVYVCLGEGAGREGWQKIRDASWLLVDELLGLYERIGKQWKNIKKCTVKLLSRVH